MLKFTPAALLVINESSFSPAFCFSNKKKTESAASLDAKPVNSEYLSFTQLTAPCKNFNISQFFMTKHNKGIDRLEVRLISR